MSSALIKKVHLEQIYGFAFITKPLTFETLLEFFSLPLRLSVNYYDARMYLKNLRIHSFAYNLTVPNET